MVNSLAVHIFTIAGLLIHLAGSKIAGAEALGNLPHDDIITGDDDFFADRDHNTCSIYLAPSDVGGWGVYAARDFDKYELVEIAPRFLPMEDTWLKQTVLDDYYYGFLWAGNKTINNFGAAILGMSMFYNHGAGKRRNVMYTNIGHEPNIEFPMYSQVLAFIALRDIKRGEELLSSYGDDEIWFVTRGLDMAKGGSIQALSEADMEAREDRYCSKVFSGLGQATFVERVLRAQAEVGDPLPQHDYNKYLPMQDYPTAVAREVVQTGQILEMAPALVVPSEHLRQSPLAPTAIFWNDWYTEQKTSLRELQKTGSFRMKVKNRRTGRVEYDGLLHVELAAILPMAGNLGMIQKVGPIGRSNCRIEIVASTSLEGSKVDHGSAGLVLKLIATTDIEPGEALRLDLPDSSTWLEKVHLLQRLASTGQPIPNHIAGSRDYAPRVPKVNKGGIDGDEL